MKIRLSNWAFPNLVLVALFSHALISSEAGHSFALEKIKEDIALLKESAGLKR